jgi:putative transposase
MSRYLLIPTPEQAAVMWEHCTHARFVWNLAVEQQSWWRRGRKSTPGYLEQCRQLTAARAENGWLRAGSHTVQQQALRDFDQAMRNFSAARTVSPGSVRRLAATGSALSAHRLSRSGG